MTDLELTGTVKEASSGSQEAWNLLVEQFAGLVWGIARSHSLDTSDASDVSQTVWLRLTEHIASLREPEHIRAWLAVTTRNESQRVLKRRRLEGSVTYDRLLALPDVDPHLPEAAMVVAEESEALWRAFATLGESCRTLLRMLIAEPPASYAVVSETLGLPIGSIGPTRSRCLHTLRKKVEENASRKARTGELSER